MSGNDSTIEIHSSRVCACAIDPGPNATSTAVSGGNCATTSVSGGNVVLDTNGTFIYDPAAGFTGTDHFFYKLTNSGGSSVGDVAVTVGDMIWFVKNDAAACTTIASNCGRLSKPFSTLAALQAINIPIHNRRCGVHLIPEINAHWAKNCAGIMRPAGW